MAADRTCQLGLQDHGLSAPFGASAHVIRERRAVEERTVAVAQLRHLRQCVALGARPTDRALRRRAQRIRTPCARRSSRRTREVVVIAHSGSSMRSSEFLPAHRACLASLASHRSPACDRESWASTRPSELGGDLITRPLARMKSELRGHCRFKPAPDADRADAIARALD